MLLAVSPWSAQRLGAIVGAALAISWVVWLRTRATPCPGAVTIEFHPPLADPGKYGFSIDLDGARPCAFSVSMPLQRAANADAKSGCAMARQLRTQVQDGQTSIAALTFAAAPERFHLRVTRNAEAVYDTDLEPKYAPYPTTRAEDKHFCGDRARVLPECRRGSSECRPFPASCDGPEDCSTHQACCLTPEWGHDFGPKSASECASVASCLAHFGHLGCHADSDCPADMRCADSTLAADFTPAVRVCQNR